MFYKWILEIVHQQTGVIRKIEKQDNLDRIAKWEREINKSGWDIISIIKQYIE